MHAFKKSVRQVSQSIIESLIIHKHLLSILFPFYHYFTDLTLVQKNIFTRLFCDSFNLSESKINLLIHLFTYPPLIDLLLQLLICLFSNLFACSFVVVVFSCFVCLTSFNNPLIHYTVCILDSQSHIKSRLYK